MEAKKTFEEKLTRLLKITDNIESDMLALEDTMKAYEEGIALVNELEQELNTAYSRFEKQKRDRIINENEKI